MLVKEDGAVISQRTRGLKGLALFSCNVSARSSVQGETKEIKNFGHIDQTETRREQFCMIINLF